MGFADQLRFLRSLAERPRMTGAVAPSGPVLARLMASHVDPADDLPVLELGPGTGVVTKALIERGVAPRRIITIEYSPDFCRLLKERHPDVTVIEGDAYDLAGSLPKDRSGPFSAVVSSLPLVARPADQRQKLIDDALNRMAPGRNFIQFSYMLHAPAEPVAGRFTAEHSHWIWMNVPPARVWLYRRPQAGGAEEGARPAHQKEARSAEGATGTKRRAAGPSIGVEGRRRPS